MSYTTAGDEGPGWLNRLPRISSTSRSQAKSFASETDGEELGGLPPGMLPPIGVPREFLRRQREEDNSSHPGSRNSSIIPRRRKKKWDDGRGPGGPISQSAIYPVRRTQSEQLSEQTSDTLTPGERSPTHVNDDDEKKESELGHVQDDPEMHEILHRHSGEEKRDQHKSDAERHPEKKEIYQEGDDLIVENKDGDVLATVKSPKGKERRGSEAKKPQEVKDDVESSPLGYRNLKKKLGVWRHKDEHEEEASPKTKLATQKRGPAMAYQFGNTIIVEDEDGEVVKTYELPSNKQTQPGQSGPVRKELTRMGTWTGLMKSDEPSKAAAPSSETPESSGVRQGLARMGTWGFGGKNTNKEDTAANAVQEDEDDDRHIRFTIGGAGRRLTKEDFLREIQFLDPKARSEVITESDAPAAMKELAKKDASENSPGSSRVFGAKNVQRASGKGVAKSVGAAMARTRGAQIEEEEGYGRDHESGSENSEEEREKRKRAKAAIELSKRRQRERAESMGERQLSKIESQMSDEQMETPAERKRREQALKGVDDVTDAQRGRSRTLEDHRVGVGSGSGSASGSGSGSGSRGAEPSETPAERRRRMAALGVGGGGAEDSDDDDTPRVPPPVAKSRGIRFAQSPVRGKK